jgi:hypothetical protein
VAKLADAPQAWGLEKASSKVEDPRDIATWLIKARDEGHRFAAPTEAALTEDTVLLLGAGRSVLVITCRSVSTSADTLFSETTAITMTTW